ncbi:unnamed protein product [Aphanomyces euteiches]
MELAAERGYASVVAFLIARGMRGSDETLEVAAESGYVGIVRLLHEQAGMPCTHLALELAAEGGHLAVVRYIVEHGDGSCMEALYVAAQHGHVHVVRWLVDRGTTYSVNEALRLAADNYAMINYLEHQAILHGIDVTNVEDPDI